MTLTSDRAVSLVFQTTNPVAILRLSKMLKNLRAYNVQQVTANNQTSVQFDTTMQESVTVEFNNIAKTYGVSIVKFQTSFTVVFA